MNGTNRERKENLDGNLCVFNPNYGKVTAECQHGRRLDLFSPERVDERLNYILNARPEKRANRTLPDAPQPLSESGNLSSYICLNRWE